MLQYLPQGTHRLPPEYPYSRKISDSIASEITVHHAAEHGVRYKNRHLGRIDYLLAAGYNKMSRNDIHERNYEFIRPRLQTHSL